MYFTFGSPPLLFLFFLRKERDSNPRYSYPYNGFRDRPDRPLRHLSFAVSLCECKSNYFFFPNYIFQNFFSKNPSGTRSPPCTPRDTTICRHRPTPNRDALQDTNCNSGEFPSHCLPQRVATHTTPLRSATLFQRQQGLR